MATPSKKKALSELNTELKKLQAELITVNKKAGVDDYITVKVTKDQARFERVVNKGEKDVALGHFYIKMDIAAKTADVYVPLSISSGKKVSGFMYLIEGTAEGQIRTANVEVRGTGVTQLTVGTLVYAKIPAGKIGTFRILATIHGSIGKTYTITLTRINYKLDVADARYQQYLKELISDSVKLS